MKQRYNSNRASLIVNDKTKVHVLCRSLLFELEINPHFSLHPHGLYSLLACTLFLRHYFLFIRLAIVLDRVSILLLDQIQRPNMCLYMPLNYYIRPGIKYVGN